MVPSRFALAFGFALLLVAPTAVPLAADWSDLRNTLCDGFTIVPGQGPSCPVPGGWNVLLDDGTTLFTHGPDLVADLPVADAGLDVAWRDPHCIGEYANTHAMLVIYARPFDKPDRYNWASGHIRNMVKASNGILYADSTPHHYGADYRVRCDGAGTIMVRNAVLPTSRHSDSFGSIASNLRAQGYTSTLSKYWVWYDDGVGWGIGGQGSLYGDDRAIQNNYNNAAPGSGASFAFTYGYLSTRIMMHENGHNLGAVQNSAPQASGGWHCNDGLDIMCYSDGGWKSRYTSSACRDRQHFDCNGDDYFNPGPAAGNYLRNHWNLGAVYNRFIDVYALPANVVPIAAFTHGCNGLTCTFDATPSRDVDGTIVSYTWLFDDGTQRTGKRVTKTFAAAGLTSVTLDVTDERSGIGTATRTVTLDPNGVPPVAAFTTSCVGLTCAFDGTASYDPDGSAVTYAWSFGDGATATSAAPAHSFAGPGSFVVELTVTDAATETARALEEVRVTADGTPPVTSASLAGTAGEAPWFRSAVTVTLTATDDLSGVASTRYRVGSGAWQPYQGPFDVTEEGQHVIAFASTDADGNVEAPRTVAVGVDVTPPLTPDVSPDGMLVYSGEPWTTLPTGRGHTIVVDARATAPFTVAADVADATSGVASVTVDGGRYSDVRRCDVTAPGNAFTCEWARSGADRVRERVVVTVADAAGNTVDVTFLVTG